MKKHLALVLGSVLAISLVVTGCGASDSNTPPAENQNPPVSGSQDPTSANQPKEITEFKYYTADELKAAIENNDPVKILDIQVEEDFAAHHIKGVIPSYAYPVKSAEDKAKLDQVLPQLTDSDDPIVIVCPGGKNGATRTYQYLYDQGIDESRLFILEKGQGGWPYDELLEK